MYWSAGLNPLADRYFLFLVVIVLTTWVSVSLGFCVSALAPSPMIATEFGSCVLIVFLLFGE